MTARVTGTPQELAISQEGKAYQIASENHELPDGLTLHIRGESTDASGNRLLVFPDGSSSGGILDLSTQNRSATLRVLPATGRVELDL
jgi:hypothetical protein